MKGTAMDCPVCGRDAAMITLELHEVEIDYCPQCEGIWLDEGELEILLGEGRDAKKLLASFRTAQNVKETARKCPICDKRMEKVDVGAGNNKELLDVCLRRHGIWFDRHELKRTLELARLDEDDKVVRLLSEMFEGTEK